ncbi:TPA: hypothetical protein QDA93_003396 [Burkholderia vietnamiensis]|nr:hypothetical protein [Burkholderia vietnamiensis]
MLEHGANGEQEISLREKSHADSLAVCRYIFIHHSYVRLGDLVLASSQEKTAAIAAAQSQDVVVWSS